MFRSQLNIRYFSEIWFQIAEIEEDSVIQELLSSFIFRTVLPGRKWRKKKKLKCFEPKKQSPAFISLCRSEE